MELAHLDYRATTAEIFRTGHWLEPLEELLESVGSSFLYSGRDAYTLQDVCHYHCSCF